MGQHIYVDLAAVRAVAEKFDASAEIIDGAVRTRLGGLAFSGVSAGRAHSADGDALRRALDRWAGELRRWARASAEIATAIRSGAEHYAEAELRTVSRVG